MLECITLKGSRAGLSLSNRICRPFAFAHDETHKVNPFAKPKLWVSPEPKPAWHSKFCMISCTGNYKRNIFEGQLVSPCMAAKTEVSLLWMGSKARPGVTTLPQTLCSAAGITPSAGKYPIRSDHLGWLRESLFSSFVVDHISRSWRRNLTNLTWLTMTPNKWKRLELLWSLICQIKTETHLCNIYSLFPHTYTYKIYRYKNMFISIYIDLLSTFNIYVLYLKLFVLVRAASWKKHQKLIPCFAYLPECKWQTWLAVAVGGAVPFSHCHPHV